MPVRSRLLRTARGKFGSLLIALVALIVAAPVVTLGQLAQFFLAVVTSTVLVAGLHAARPGRRSLAVGLFLAGVDLGIGQLTRIEPAHWLILAQAALWFVTLLFVAVIILEWVLSSEPVTIETLQAAFCVFLLLGLVWTYFYIGLTLLQPSSFESPGGLHLLWDDVPARRRAFLSHLIFSYSTLAGAPYSGLAPVSDFASIFSCLEAMMAQVYLAVVVARLVGIQAARGSEQERTDEERGRPG